MIYKYSQQQPKMTKEQFLIQYVLTRAAFREENFSGEAAARAASKVWDEIQRLK